MTKTAEPDGQDILGKGKEESPSFKSMELVDGIIPFTDIQKCYIKKWFPRMGVCVGALGVLELGTAIAVVVIEGDHAAVSSVSFMAAPAVVIVAGILSLLAGTFIFYMTKCRPVTKASMRKWILVTFIVLLVVAAVFSFMGAVIGLSYRGQAMNKMEADMKNKLQEYGLTGRYKSLTIINKIQSKDACCGVINYVDWRNTTYGGHRYDKVPDSCCKQEEHACGFEFELSKINHRGCLKIVKSSAAHSLMLIGFVGIIIFVIKLALAGAVFVIRKKHFA